MRRERTVMGIRGSGLGIRGHVGWLGQSAAVPQKFMSRNTAACGFARPAAAAQSDTGTISSRPRCSVPVSAWNQTGFRGESGHETPPHTDIGVAACHRCWSTAQCCFVPVQACSTRFGRSGWRHGYETQCFAPKSCLLAIWAGLARGPLPWRLSGMIAGIVLLSGHFCFRRSFERFST